MGMSINTPCSLLFAILDGFEPPAAAEGQAQLPSTPPTYIAEDAAAAPLPQTMETGTGTTSAGAGTMVHISERSTNATT
jgi:hypothetical protein